MKKIYRSKETNQIRLKVIEEEKDVLPGNVKKEIYITIFNNKNEEILKLEGYKIMSHKLGLFLGNKNYSIDCYNDFFVVNTREDSFTMSEHTVHLSFKAYDYQGNQIAKAPYCFNEENHYKKILSLVKEDDSESHI